MNEFTLIMIGALAVTVLVFFLFFRSPDADGGKGLTIMPPAPPASSATSSSTSMTPAADSRLEQRVADLEVSLGRLASSAKPSQTSAQVQAPADAGAVATLDQRVTRMERAMTLKLDALMERLAKMETKMAKQAAALKQQAAVVKPAPAPAKPVAAAPPKAPLKKKAVASPKKKKNLFHTVKKGETLWSISQKYKTTVVAVRKLNNMTAKDKIYPGNNILVR